ncbi:hemoglobin, alpha embryonic 5 [Eucyclogobius newberryi]|uniref:hemoglobin, alpha embryonic 5 n=1 Tax=Eucyclogobius newberryi TaxID=166745 RepID=UPI003B59BDD8
MSLSKKDKANVKALWSKVSGAVDTVGTETLSRLFICYPQSKIYFSHWADLTPNSAAIRTHAPIILSGVTLAVKNIEDINTSLLELSEKHAFQLKVDPSNFKFIFHCLMVVIASMFPNDFPAEVHVSFDKFLALLALGLCEKFR